MLPPLLALLPLALLLAPVAAAATAAAPVAGASAAPADPAAVVLSADGKARFTVLGAQLLRLEFSESGKFDDRQSLSFVNRRLPVPAFNHSTVAGVLRLQTGSLLLSYAAAAPPPPPPPRPDKARFCDGLTMHRPRCSQFPPPRGGSSAGSCLPYRSPSAPHGLATDTAGCCAACLAAPDCNTWAYTVDNTTATGGGPDAAATCFLYTTIVSVEHSAANDVVGGNFLPPPATGFRTGELRVRSLAGVTPAFDWRFGTVDAGNLLGTATALDNIEGPIELNCSDRVGAGDHTPNGGMNIGCDLGPLSRDGWAVLDDSLRPRLDPATQWVAPPPPQSDRYTDLYFFGFGHEYKQALRAYTSVAGAAKAPPRFALGVWWSRYWPYTAEDLEDIARGYAEHSIPLDVLVSDMAWHYHGEKPVSWAGYTWGKQLFPNPSGFLEQAAQAGLNLTLNLHLDPVDPANEDPAHYAAFATKLGLSPSANLTIPSQQSAPFTGTVAEEITKSKEFATAYLELLDEMGTNWW